MKKTIAEPHMLEERRRAHRWYAGTYAGGLAALASAFLLIPLGWHLAHTPFGRASYDATVHYLLVATAQPIATLSYFIASPHSPAPVAEAIASLFFAMLAVTAGVILSIRSCPHRALIMTQGDARWATARDLEAMDADDQIGPKGTYLHFGYPTALGTKERLALIETLSVLAFAPPGTGKTASLVVPGIMSTDRASFIVHDPKPELWPICSGHRARLGPTFRLDWGRMDNPEKREWNPSFNFLDPRIVPPDGPGRETFVDTISRTLVPAKDTGDTFFPDKGRAALIGFTHWLICAINDDRDNPRRWIECDLPERWHGKQASFGMLVEWIVYAQIAAKKRAREQGEQNTNPISAWIQSLVDTAIEKDFHPRCISELSPMIDQADKERSGVLSTVDQALIPFKNAAVAQRTSRSDFVPADMCGRIKPSVLEHLAVSYPETREEWDAIAPHLTDPDAWEPVTVFLCLNQSDAPAFAQVSALFFEVLSLERLSFGPGERTRSGAIMGPFPTTFLMDELVKFGKCDAVVNGPDLGRSKKCIYVLIAQDRAQIEVRYSAQQAKIIMSTCAVHCVLPQNSPETIKGIVEMVGKTMVKKTNITRNVGLSKSANPFAGNQSESVEAADLLNTSTLARMKKGEMIVLCQNFMSRPIQSKTARYFSDRYLSSVTRNPRTGLGPEPAPFLPKAWTDALDSAQSETERAQAQALAETTAADTRFERRFWADPATLGQTPALAP